MANDEQENIDIQIKIKKYYYHKTIIVRKPSKISYFEYPMLYIL